ncbi:MAG: hypothetical protein ACFE9S_15340 [Candidatus Hermodarchaeota archaeon]
MEELTSIGRRGFNVCLHHSNRIGIVLTDDRSFYNWNCSRSTNEKNTRVLNHNLNSPFEVNNRQRNFPYIYE